jgi:NADH dehydrogenase
MSSSGPRATRVVVLGAGFAGLAVCNEMVKSPAGAALEIVIVDRHTYNTFQPLLYQVATAGLSPGDIAYGIRSFTRRHPNVAFRQGIVSDVDFSSKTVRFDDNAEPLHYDYLVVATGATTNFFGVPGAAEHSYAIYTMDDALTVRDRVFAALEKSASFGAPGGDLVVVIVGGGPTGVEMAGTLAEVLALEIETAYRTTRTGGVKVVLIEQLERLLTGFSERQSAYALGALQARGVEVRLGTVVAEIGQGAVVLKGGESISTPIIVWAAGVVAGELAGRLETPKTHGGRIEVSPDLSLAVHPEVFVAGDLAGAALPEGRGLVPQLAQPALQEGAHVARQIMHRLADETTEAFCYHDKGIMATIGRRAAVAELPSGITLRGTLAWLAWLGLHIVFLLGARNRVAVMLNWAWRYIWWRRGTRVIAGT